MQKNKKSMTKKNKHVELELRPEFVKKILKLKKEHFKKYGYRAMSKKEMDELFGK